ncbi:haloalkane dehalogenase [Nocardioides marmoribigeumensis]|uniref:Haloalkane dehalogenase n=1 Tax=Nocardioides marmoribigeumensis TaxID=433649 RepID=A0ABU2BQP6_9ACTN|nr:haloalkane dehalogenase [Nocardioides marmoribigeumensis]MDR7360948.1 haloalkane dehalogenase [Nocardioides marmoribigeumensis]
MSRSADVLRTPDERFEGLPGYDFAPHYTEVDGLRLHHVDEGPRDAAPVLMLHGEPSWSYLYRHMVPVFAGAGLRAVAPDLVGFGRSDKPTVRSAYSYQAHVDWMASWLEAVDLRDVTLVCQDWGSLIGLRLVAEHQDRFARVVVANGFLPTADRRTPPAFHLWRAFALHSPVLPVGRIVDVGCRRRLSAAERRAYDAPYPSSRYKAGARAFPALVPTSPDDPAVPANRAAWEALGRWEKPFLTLFGAGDPILGRADRPLQQHVPGAAGQPHDRLPGGHFVQEDQGEEIARRVVAWIG